MRILTPGADPSRSCSARISVAASEWHDPVTAELLKLMALDRAAGGMGAASGAALQTSLRSAPEQSRQPHAYYATRCPSTLRARLLVESYQGLPIKV